MLLRGRLLTTILLATLLAALPAFAAGDAAASGFIAVPGMERPPLKLATQLRPLDDPANPYARQYHEWDIWAFEHFQPGKDAQAIMAELQPPEPKRSGVSLATPFYLWRNTAGQPVLWMEHRVDSEGFLLPWELASANYGPNGKRFGSASQPVQELARALSSAPVEQALFDEWQQRYTAGIALRYPPIPAFIGEQPPVALVFVPNGEFAVKGRLGLGETDNFDMQASHKLASRERWYRYSAAGELLGMTGVVGGSWRDNSWMLLYWPGLADKITAMQEQGLSAYIRSGTVSFTQDRSRHYTNEADVLWDRDRPWPALTAADVVECYDYMGNPLPVAEAWPEDADMLDNVRQLDAPIIAMYYAAQLRVGYSTDTPSPFAGLANGPQLAGPGYEPPKVAWPSMGGDGTFVEKLPVHDLDDSANPYLGSYSEWDRLCFEHYGEYNPQEMMLLNRNLSARQQLVDEAKAAGQSLEDFKAQHHGMNFGLDLESYAEAGLATLFCYVDDNGYVIPMSVLHSWSGARTDGTRHTDWTISATVKLDEQDMARFEAWKAAQEAGSR